MISGNAAYLTCDFLHAHGRVRTPYMRMRATERCVTSTLWSVRGGTPRRACLGESAPQADGRTTGVAICAAGRLQGWSATRKRHASGRRRGAARRGLGWPQGKCAVVVDFIGNRKSMLCISQRGMRALSCKGTRPSRHAVLVSVS